ncbi:hypothetical protein AMS68_002050 [Peltaster fructicola]|uniref:GAT domain-containing protein n=1 Tax=Peltaster fructicola TaxID=286661 RepID=A0A6H0XP90_9PEZI|nr:hypothetical protein AMS68_002050 [Peltaster fructicola]
MKRFSTLLRGKGRPARRPASLILTTAESRSQPDTLAATSDESTNTSEGKASQAVRLFCESTAANRDEEVLHLPTIVDGAESSPAAAAACAARIRHYLQKSYLNKPQVQYNAVMLVRILSDHPGESFTRNFDDKFVKSIKAILRGGRDPSVQQLLRETLDNLASKPSADPGLQALVAMWNREKSLYTLAPPPIPQGGHIPVRDGTQGLPPPLVHNNSSGSRSRHQLPSPPELASRIEESRNTAKILIQFLQTTPAEEISTNDLVKEFAERCQSAQRSMQTYINCENPAPDDDTLQTLIETNEQLSLACSRYQRAVLAARRALGVSSTPEPEQRSTSTSSQPPQIVAPIPQQSDFGSLMNGSTGFSSASTRQPNPSVSPPVEHSFSALPSRQPEPVVSAALPQSQAQPSVRHEHKVSASSHTPSRPDDDYDDLYDSPRVARAPASDPFADPIPSPPLPADQAVSHQSTYSPVSPQQTNNLRPAPGAWHNSTITPSFLGRQASAANGLTMHAPSDAAELDSNSKVGRTDYRAGASEPQKSFTVTHAPTEALSQRLDRVDIAGTGGFKPI